MILIVRTAQSTLETTNETVVPPLLPSPPARRLRQDQPRRASLEVPIHYATEADIAAEKEWRGWSCVCCPHPLHQRCLLLCRVNSTIDINGNSATGWQNTASRPRWLLCLIQRLYYGYMWNKVLQKLCNILMAKTFFYFHYFQVSSHAHCRPPSRSRKPLRLAEDILRLASRGLRLKSADNRLSKVTLETFCRRLKAFLFNC